MPKNYWLFKSEPEIFSVDHLAALPDQTTAWEGVRNYMARNLLRDKVKLGDDLFFYHSSTELKGIAGICTVVRGAYPDPSARDPQSEYFDPKVTDNHPVWYVVDVRLVQRLPQVILLSQLKQTHGLEKMMVCQRGARLSIQPVTPAEWKVIGKLIEKQS